MINSTVPWYEGAWLGFDTETTGVWVKRDRIATASLIWREGGDNRVHNWIINPGVPMPPQASAVNGLTDDYLAQNGEQPAGALEKIASELASAMSRGIPAVGFNVSFDFQILEAELARNGLPTVQERLGGALAPIIDPLVLDRALDRYRRGKRRLAAVCAVYGLGEDRDFHHAEADVAATLDLLSAMVDRFEELRAMTLTELQQFQRDSHRIWAESFNEFMKQKHGNFHPAPVTWPVP
ncbi:MAG: exonuclease domain-containing protein [Mobiluncus porci]|uniref:DNA polymerase III subunit epsilon n=1 Tax=Mobiluncus porci TaxID=2652278 RepID=A0A7K0K3F7_9ACTO|nr:exonuclease domain-containing protein [Mobiluncus porci]MDD7542545.1 exonuclease domain-containing protein [Mobiluncus porci]MDY5748842.1 exonuclease domain-containing protein [Mobiluncus porci]MST50016.1 DNA polymerase III subunit epsilon [Mobiluncus porci]